MPARPRPGKLVSLTALIVGGAIIGTSSVTAGEPVAERGRPPAKAGFYKGRTEEDKVVQFRLTRGAKIAGFKMDVVLYCTRDRSTQLFPPLYYDYKRSTEIFIQRRIPMRKVSRRHPLGKKFEYAEPYPPEPAQQPYRADDAKGTHNGYSDFLRKFIYRGFAGEAGTYMTDGPENQDGTERCATRVIDYWARRQG